MVKDVEGGGGVGNDGRYGERLREITSNLHLFFIFFVWPVARIV